MVCPSPDLTAKFAPVWTNILKIEAIFVHQTLTKHALFIDKNFVSNERNAGMKIRPNHFLKVNYSVTTYQVNV